MSWRRWEGTKVTYPLYPKETKQRTLENSEPFKNNLYVFSLSKLLIRSKRGFILVEVVGVGVVLRVF
jgi:hypothetical protein